LETVLNLVWTTVSLGLLLTCGIHVLRGGEDRRRGMAAVALLCLVCLLFPVISATDDVNAASPALVEPSKVKKLVASPTAVLTVMPLLDLLRPQDNSKASLELPPDSRRPQQDVFAFHLCRRPPPLQVA